MPAHDKREAVTLSVMPGFMHRRAKARRSSNGYGIHVFLASLKTWMAGTSPAMTIELINDPAP
jgi:hypothetical protein